MKTDSPSHCEVKIDGVWLSVPVKTAHGLYRDNLKRCPACHGAVTTAAIYALVERVRFQHLRTHAGCPLSVRGFSGVASEHPEAVI